MQRLEKYINHLSTTRINVPEEVANELGFNSQKFRSLFVQWIIDSNYPLREVESPVFRKMIAAANPLAEEALWHNHQSVTRYITY